MSAPFRLGVVGGGRMGQTHIRALVDSTAVDVVAVAEPRAEVAEGLREGGQTVVPTAADLLTRGGIDGVLVVVPTDQHRDLIAELAPSGLPILCEKPCGLSSAEAGDIGRIVDRHGTLLQIAYWRRFIPALQDLRGRIEAGTVGRLHFTFCSQWDEAPPSIEFRTHSGGIFVDMGVHEIDQIRWLSGAEVQDVSVATVSAVADPTIVADVDSAEALLAMSDGSVAGISLGRFHPGGDLVAVEVFAERFHDRVTVLEPSVGVEPQLEALRRQAEAFARWASGGVPEGATIEDALAALVVAERLSELGGIKIQAGPA